MKDETKCLHSGYQPKNAEPRVMPIVQSRMKQYCENAMTVAKYLEQSDKVEKVNYPGLESDENYELAQRYLSGCSGVTSFVIKGGKEAAVKFMNKLKLASNEVHVSDIRTCVLHPASETHRQLTDEQLAAAGIEQGFYVIAAGAFIAEHSVFPSVASGFM